MFPDLFSSSRRGGSRHAGRPFVRDVTVKRTRVRNSRAEQIMVAGWVLIAIKSVLVWWACTHYPVPFHPNWVIVPTVAMGLLCTGLYYFCRR